MLCPNCKSQNIEIFHDKVWSLDDGKVYKCNSCELLFIAPMMSDDEERKFYENYNQHVQNRGMTVEKSVEEFHQKSLPTARERLAVLQKYFNNKKILEIGSSTGAFLSLLENCKTNACELATDNLHFSKQFINGRAYKALEDVNENNFDIICMFHVFEHIKEPIKFLKSCAKLLKPDGLIIIEVPHSNDPLLTLYDCQEFKDFVFQPMHPMIYNKPSLDYVFHQSNLENSEVIYHQRYGLENHLSWFKNKKAGGDIQLTELFSKVKEYKEVLESIKLTDTIFYIARAK